MLHNYKPAHTAANSQAKQAGTDILVFKTNLSSQKHVGKVKLVLNLHPCIKEWNVDLQDQDKVLRVVSQQVEAKEIEQIIAGAGYFCQELE